MDCMSLAVTHALVQKRLDSAHLVVHLCFQHLLEAGLLCINLVLHRYNL